MIFTRYSLQFERALKNLTPNTERATKKQNAFWAGFRKKEESYYFFPDPVILINNEPSLMPKNKSCGYSVTHVTCGTIKFVLEYLGHLYYALQRMTFSGTASLVLL